MPLTEPTPPLDRRETVAFVIPLFNEEAVFPLLFEALEAYRAAHPEVVQVVFVDDGSRDRTSELVRRATESRAGYVLVSFSRNFGHQLAVTAGLHFVEADAAVIMDADLQDPLAVVTEMIEKWREGYDVVYGVRRQRVGESSFKRATAALFYRLFRRMTDLDIPLDTGDFRLIGRPVIEAYKRIEEQQPFVRGLIAWLGFNQTGIPYDRAPRAAGKTKYPLRKMLRLASGSLVSFSDKPLRLAVQLGLGVAFLSFVGLVWVLIAKYGFAAVIPGWSSLIFVAFFFGGIQLFFLGVLGVYLARVSDEVRRRPRYIVQDLWTSDAETDVPTTEEQLPSSKAKW